MAVPLPILILDFERERGGTCSEVPQRPAREHHLLPFRDSVGFAGSTGEKRLVVRKRWVAPSKRWGLPSL
jgi:hypothetical protein